MYDAYYFATGCGPPYQRDEDWLRVFGSIADRIVRDIGPSTVLDAGCAMGFLVEALRQRGVEAYGVDISEYAMQNVHSDIQAHCWVGTVTDPFPQHYDLIVCIEVLEHLARQEGMRAIENLCRHTDDVLFSSTPLDYKEVTHVNVQPPEYWAELFARQGFFRDMDFDASFIAPWSMRFRRTSEPVARVVAGYERHYYRLLRENVARREHNIEQRNELSTKEQAVQALMAEASERDRALRELEQQLAEAEEALRGSKEEIQSLRESLRHLETRRARLEESVGWVFLRRLQALRLRVAPPGTTRERLLEAVFRRIRGQVPADTPSRHITR